MPRPAPADLVDAYTANSPGYYFRRLHQLSTALFIAETAHLGITPVQYVTLLAIASGPGSDQRTIARKAGLDFATAAGVVQRLEKRGLITRSGSEADRRVRCLFLAPDGEDLLARIQPAAEHVRARLLEPLPAGRRQELMQLLRMLHEGHAGTELPAIPDDVA